MEKRLARHKSLEDEAKQFKAELRATEKRQEELVAAAREKISIDEAKGVILERLHCLLLQGYEGYTLYSMQRYRTNYLLAKLTQYVDMAYKGLKTPGSLAEYDGLEIEHILPDRPKSDLRAAFAANNPGADYDEYKNRLGNLTLLEKPINIVAGNDFFSGKKAEYRKCKYYLTSSIAELNTVGQDTSINQINAKLAAFDSWTSADIDQRHALLISLAREVWKTAPIEVGAQQVAMA